MLQFSGLNRTDSFALYGITTGIVLPFILFPGTITNSLSVLLLPEVSKAFYERDNPKIMRTTQITIKYSLLLGCIAMAVFVCFGPQIGTMFFHNPRSGKLLSLLSMICPFVYVSTTLASIINGLVKKFDNFSKYGYWFGSENCFSDYGNPIFWYIRVFTWDAGQPDSHKYFRWILSCEKKIYKD